MASRSRRVCQAGADESFRLQTFVSPPHKDKGPTKKEQQTIRQIRNNIKRQQKPKQQTTRHNNRIDQHRRSGFGFWCFAIFPGCGVSRPDAFLDDQHGPGLVRYQSRPLGTPKPQNPKTPKPQHPKTLKPPNPTNPKTQNPKTPNPKTPKPQNPKTPTLQNAKIPKPQTPKPQNPKTHKTPKPQNPKNPKLKTPKPKTPHPKTPKPQNPNTPKPQNPKTPTLQNAKIPKPQTPKPQNLQATFFDSAKQGAGKGCQHNLVPQSPHRVLSRRRKTNAQGKMTVDAAQRFQLRPRIV